MYRPREWNREEREKKNRTKKVQWFKTGGYDSVMFIPSTPYSTLKKSFDKEIQRSGYKFRVVEQAGISLKSILQRSDPSRDSTCNRRDCFVCTSGGRGRCDEPNVTYDIECGECNAVYVGQTSKNAYSRGKEHARQMISGTSPMSNHCRKEHAGDEPFFKMNVTGSFGNDAMLRQISESVLIHHNRVGGRSTMNTKGEWNYIRLPRVQLEGQ